MSTFPVNFTVKCVLGNGNVCTVLCRFGYEINWKTHSVRKVAMGYRFCSVTQRVFLYVSLLVLWASFPSFFIARLLEDWKYFHLQVKKEPKDYKLLGPLERANFGQNYCNIPSSSFCKWFSPRHHLLNKSRRNELHNKGKGINAWGFIYTVPFRLHGWQMNCW